MSEPTFSSRRSKGNAPDLVETLHHLEESHRLSSVKSGRHGKSEPESSSDLRQELDVVRSKLLMAVDAVAGAEAERSAAQSRVRDLEHQHHMFKVERDELRREVDRLSSRRVISRLLGPIVHRLHAGARSR